MNIEISKSNKKDKKLKAVIDGKKTIHFGQAGASDFTKHKDPERKDNYISRHKKREDWGKTGVDTAGFMSKNLLWNKPTLEASVNDLNKRYKDINFKLTHGKQDNARSKSIKARWEMDSRDYKTRNL